MNKVEIRADDVNEANVLHGRREAELGSCQSGGGGEVELAIRWCEGRSILHLSALNP